MGMTAQLYLDANAHVPMSDETQKALAEFNNSPAAHGHPLSPSIIGRAAARAIEESRTKIAELIGAESPGQIFFTTSCTQACAWVATMFDDSEGALTAISNLEHPAMKQAFTQDPFQYTFDLPSNADGIVQPPFGPLGLEKIDPDIYQSFEWESFCKPEMVLVCIHTHNEIGTIQPIERMTNSMVVSDMSQSLGKIPVNVTDLGVHIAVFGAHKFGGPGGVGFIYLKDTTRWSQFGTGSRYYMDIPGTPNVSAISATSVALDVAIQTLGERQASMVAFQNCLEPGLEELGFEIIAKNSRRCPNVSFVKAPRNATQILIDLGRAGIHCGLGSACGSLYTESTPLLKALGRKDDGRNYLRLSQWGKYGETEAKHVLDVMACIVK